jgi:hypothetical protein
MNINQIIKLTLKARKLTKKGVDQISKLPMEKIVVGTVVTVVPGAMIATGAYMAGNKLLKKYRAYKEVQNQTQEPSTSFMVWAKNETSEGMSNGVVGVKNMTVKFASSTGKMVSDQTTSIKHYAVKKASSFLTKK